MVKLNHAMKSDKSIFMGITRAQDLFLEVAEKGDDDEPAIDFENFTKLIGLILKESNAEAKGRNKTTIPIPSVKDLKILFNRADEDNSKTVDAYEFLELYKAVMEGNVKGLGNSVFSFYTRPHQLMQFGQHEHHPDTDWQDLFFDLLFVGGAYQTGNFLAAALVNDDHIIEGVLWSFGIFICLAQQWFMKMLLSARFGYSSMFHYMLDTCAMWHIPASDVTVAAHGSSDSSYSAYSAYSSTYSAYSSTYSAYSSSYGVRRLGGGSYYGGDGDTITYTPLEQLQSNVQGRAFGFSLCLALNNFLYVLKWSEIITDKEASPGAVTISNHQAFAYFLGTVIFSVTAKISYQKVDDDDDGLSEYVIYFWLFGVAVYIASFYYWVHFLHIRKAKGLLHLSGVPMNVNYVIHRVGEFCMLMIGETVLSLLVVNLEPAWKNYLMFCAGMIIACNLHFHHFSTYPADHSKHVLHKGTFDFRSLSYICTMIFLYPFCLIIVGVCLKVLLKKADYGKVYNDTNWVLAIGLCFQYCFINFFIYIHDRSRGKDKRWHPCKNKESSLLFFKIWAMKTPTLIALLVVAGLKLRPYPMLMLSLLVVVVQSALILYFAKTEDEEEKVEIAKMDLMYREQRMSMASSRFNSGEEGREIIEEEEEVIDDSRGMSLDRSMDQSMEKPKIPMIGQERVEGESLSLDDDESIGEKKKNKMMKSNDKIIALSPTNSIRSQRKSREELKRHVITERINSQPLESHFDNSYSYTTHDNHQNNHNQNHISSASSTSSSISRTSQQPKKFRTKQELIADNVMIQKAFDVMKSFDLLSPIEIANVEEKLLMKAKSQPVL